MFRLVPLALQLLRLARRAAEAGRAAVLGEDGAADGLLGHRAAAQDRCHDLVPHAEPRRRPHCKRGATFSTAAAAAAAAAATTTTTTATAVAAAATTTTTTATAAAAADTIAGVASGVRGAGREGVARVKLEHRQPQQQRRRRRWRGGSLAPDKASSKAGQPPSQGRWAAPANAMSTATATVAASAAAAAPVPRVLLRVKTNKRHGRGLPGPQRIVAQAEAEAAVARVPESHRRR